MADRLLILGSDYVTLYLAKEAHRMGLYVIEADLMPDSPTKAQADEAWLVSTTDLDALETRCRACNVAGVIAGASDFNISNSRLLARRRGLPVYCPDDRLWADVRNKIRFKEMCLRVGAPTAERFPLTAALRREDLDAIRYPVVVKPADKSGNRGFSYCENEQELLAGWEYARSVSDPANIIVERKLVGPEYNVHYLVAEGEAAFLYLNATFHEQNQAANLYSFKCTTANGLPQYMEEVHPAAVRLIREMGITDGIVWFDMMLDRDGHYYLLEMGHRFGGNMTYVPYERVCGFRTTRWMLECALGIPHHASDLPDILSQPKHGIAASYNLFAQKAARVASIQGLDEVSRLPGVWVDCPKREGSELRFHTSSGLIGIYGQTAAEVCERLRTINAALHFYDDTGSELMICYDDYEQILQEYEHSRGMYCYD